MKIEKRITEKEFKQTMNSGSWDEVLALSDKWSLQYIKDILTKDADFEIIEPKQLPESNQLK